jgi:heat-inducible transcriptional repressor
MQDYRLSIDETKSMHLAFEEKMQKVDRVMDQVAKLVSQATDLPAISMASHRGGCTVKRYDLILAGAGSVILVLMLSNEEITNKLIKLPVNLAETDLQILGAVINAALTQLTAEEFTPERMEQVMRAAGSAAALVPVIVEFALQTLRRQQEADIRVAGHMRLLGQPEYRDVEKAQKVLSTLDGDMITNLPAVMNSGNGTKVLVGPENVASELKDTSVVMTKFDIGDGMHGMIGVVGPTRMDYAKVTARLSFFAENLSKLFSKNEQMTLPSGGEEPHEEA